MWGILETWKEFSDTSEITFGSYMSNCQVVPVGYKYWYNDINTWKLHLTEYQDGKDNK